MAENRHTRSRRAARDRAMRDVKEWRIVVYSGGAVVFDRTVRNKEAAQKLWAKHRESECWVECYADGRKLKWVESERVLMGYAYHLLGGAGRSGE